jgi:hypothetical protein
MQTPIFSKSSFRQDPDGSVIKDKHIPQIKVISHTSFAEPKCYISDPGLKGSRIRIRSIQVFLTQKIVSQLSEIFIPDPHPDLTSQIQGSKKSPDPGYVNTTTQKAIGLTGSDNEDAAISLGCSGDHVLDEVPVAGGVNDGNVVLRGLELPERNVDGDATLTLRLQFVQHPGVLEGALAHLHKGNYIIWH